MARRKVKNGERAPGDNVLPDQFQTVAAVLVSDWCQKAFVIFLCFFLSHTFKPWLLPRLCYRTAFGAIRKAVPY